MSKKNDYILMLAALILLILSGSIVFWFSSVKKQNGDASQSLEPKIVGKAVLTIDFSNGKKRSFEGEIIENETLLDALLQASRVGDFSYELDEKNNLAAIDSFTYNKNKSWQWRLNDEKIDEPLNEIILKSGDKIMIKYE